MFAWPGALKVKCRVNVAGAVEQARLLGIPGRCSRCVALKRSHHQCRVLLKHKRAATAGKYISRNRPYPKLKKPGGSRVPASSANCYRSHKARYQCRVVFNRADLQRHQRPHPFPKREVSDADIAKGLKIAGTCAKCRRQHKTRYQRRVYFRHVD